MWVFGQKYVLFEHGFDHFVTSFKSSLKETPAELIPESRTNTTLARQYQLEVATAATFCIWYNGTKIVLVQRSIDM
jgi:hypothetical protein